MTKHQFRVCDEDQQEYGGTEWVTLDLNKLINSRSRELERIEKELGISMREIVVAIKGEGPSIGIRALVWIARYQNGLKTPFAEFNIRTLRVDVEVVPDERPEPDVAPLDGSPSSSATPT